MKKKLVEIQKSLVVGKPVPIWSTAEWKEREEEEEEEEEEEKEEEEEIEKKKKNGESRHGVRRTPTPLGA